MMNRRNLAVTAASVAAAAVSGTLPSLKAQAKGLDMDLEPRGTIDGMFERLPELRLESELDFYTSYRTWARRDIWRRARDRAVQLAEARGINPRNDDMDVRDVVEMLEDDPLLSFMVHSRETTQQIMYKSIQSVFHAEADRYLDEMDEAQRRGPGTIELHPEMHIPDFAKHEIHLQPGGYVGDPFAGHIFYHSLNVEIPHGNFADDAQGRAARRVQTPADGKVNRILDQGCSSGQLVLAMKQRFPDAEVWGNDVGGPMIRFAHMRSVDLGIETHYIQELAEKSHFPDNHFDIITNWLLFHEVPESSGREIIHESFRLLRPGGVWFPMDLYTASLPKNTAYDKFFWWFDHRWNYEVWTYEYRNLALDFENEMRRAGFEVVRGPEGSGFGRSRNIMGIKPA